MAEDLDPSKIPSGTKGNFKTLADAQEAGDLALMRAFCNKTNRFVTLICAVNRDDQFEFVPLAVMVESDDPYNDFIPATDSKFDAKVLELAPKPAVTH